MKKREKQLSNQTNILLKKCLKLEIVKVVLKNLTTTITSDLLYSSM